MMSGYGKRSAPVATKVLSPEALERWRDRARTLLNNNDNSAPAAGEATVAAAAAAEPGVETDPAQRRRAVRQKTLIGGKVVFNDMMSVYDCTVRDLSETGARVKLNAPVQVPAVFMLRLSDGHIHQCKVRRRMALELGVEFID